MEPDYPTPAQIPGLKALWQEAFGDPEEFLTAFFIKGFSPCRCRCITEEGHIKAALYWFDCTLQGQKYAYLYAVATVKSDRGRGLCTALMEDTHALLRSSGYAGVILVPGERSLFRFYERLGYQTAANVRELECTAVSTGNRLSLREISVREYGALRQNRLPQGSVVQEGPTLAFLDTYAQFACTEDFIMAYTQDGHRLICHELLGKADLEAVVSSLGCTKGRFRIPGDGRSFAMFLPLQEGVPTPQYFGLALD